MTLVILLCNVLGDALLELLEHVREVGLFVACRLFLVDDHARALGSIVAQQLTQIHESSIAR